MKKIVIAILAGLIINSPTLAKNVIVKTIDNKTYSVPEENAKAFEEEYNLSIKNQEQKEIIKKKNYENMLYQMCLNRIYIHYSQAYEINTCICFVEENLKLSEKDLDKMAKSDIYMAKIHENIFGQCHQKNLKYTGMLTSNPYHQELNEQLKWDY